MGWLECTMAGVIILGSASGVDCHSRGLQVDAAREARTPCMQPLTEPHAGQSDLLLTAGAGMPSVSQRQRYKNRNPTALITCKCSSIVAPL